MGVTVIMIMEVRIMVLVVHAVEVRGGGRGGHGGCLGGYGRRG